MESFDSLDKYEIYDKSVFVVSNPSTCSRDDLLRYYQTDVLIDEIQYKVLGIDSFAIPIQHEGLPIGFWVE